MNTITGHPQTSMECFTAFTPLLQCLGPMIDLLAKALSTHSNKQIALRAMEAIALFCGVHFESYLKDVIPCVMELLRDPESEGIHTGCLSLLEAVAIATGQIFLEHVDFHHMVAGVINAIKRNNSLFIKLATYQFARNITNSFPVIDPVEDLHLLVPLLEKSCGLVESLNDTHGMWECFNTPQPY